MANTQRINELIDERVSLVKESRDFLDSREGKLTAEDDASWQKMHNRIEELGKEVETLEAEDHAIAERTARQEQAEADLAAIRSQGGIDKLIARGGNAPREIVGNDGAVAIDPFNAVNLSIQGWALGQKNPLAVTDEHRNALKASGCRIEGDGGLFVPLNRQPLFRWQHGYTGSAPHAIVNAQSTSATEGGEYIPTGFSGELERALLEFGGVRRACRVLRTDSGNDLPFPTTNDTGNTGALLSENIQDSEQDIVTSSTTLQAYKYTSKIVRVSVELLQDSAFDMASTVGSMLGERLGRIQNTHATTGTGSSQPNGVVTASTAGNTAAATGAVTADEVIDLQHSVDPAYRRMGAVWMFNDATLAAIRKLKGSDNNYLWQPGLSAMQPDVLLGSPYVVNQDMASMAASAKTILYGDFSKYICREVRGVTLVRMDERYADYHQVGFVAFMRFDADLIDAGTNPIKHLIQAAS